MSYADGLLANDETVVRREHQHWIFPFYIAGKWVAIAVLVTVVGFILSQFVFKSERDRDRREHHRPYQQHRHDRHGRRPGVRRDRLHLLRDPVAEHRNICSPPSACSTSTA